MQYIKYRFIFVPSESYPCLAMVDHAMRGFSDLSAAFDKGKSRKSVDLDESQSQPFPPVTAAQETSPVKKKLAKMRKLMEEEAAGTGSGSSGSSHVATSQILEAISAVPHKLDKKVDKTDMDALTENLKQHCKVTVAEAVDPLKSELHDLKDCVHNLKGRVLAIESGPSCTATPGVSEDVAQLQKLVQDLDPSKKFEKASCFYWLAINRYRRGPHPEDR